MTTSAVFAVQFSDWYEQGGRREWALAPKRS